MREPATIVDVARRAGVSLGSASRALNNRGASPDMVKRVNKAAAELNYKPDAVGRSLRTKRTSQIGFAVADIGNPVYVEMLGAIHAKVGAEGSRVVIMETGPDSKSVMDLIKSVDTGFVDGLIISPLVITPELVEALLELRVPAVVIGAPLADEGLDSVSTNSAAGVAMAVDHLVERGAKRLTLLNGPPETTPGAARSLGFRQAVGRRSDQISSSSTVFASDFTVDAGFKVALELLKADPPDAVVAANDLLAVGVMRAAHQLGLDVPEDLMVTGVDNTDIAAYFDPSLTSVSLGAAERGRKAEEMLVARIAGNSDEPQSVEVNAHLVERNSTRRGCHK